jgi:hypothetical protein
MAMSYPFGNPERRHAYMMADTRVSSAAVSSETPAAEESVSILKPKGESKLAKFKSSNLTPEKVETRLPGLSHHPISDANDWVKLHQDEANYWSDEYCFVNVPIPGQKREQLHLVVSDMAAQLPPAKVQKFRLALATKPYDNFFLAHVPSQNLENKWNETNLAGCVQAKQFWTQSTSLYSVGKEGYKNDVSLSEKEGKGPPFPDPKWPSKTLDELIEEAFSDRMILNETHPAWARLVGSKQKLS